MKPRFGAAILILLACSARPLFAAPANDNFNSATVLTGTNVAVIGSNVDSTKEVGEPNHAANPGGSSVWWQWTARGGGSVIIQTSGSAFDTLLAVYTGATLSTLSAVASNDDAGSVHTSQVGFNVVDGAVYQIAVDGYNGDSGTIQLTLTYRSTPLERPPNDLFANRIPILGSAADVAGANFFASKEPTEPNHVGELGGASVWWSWTAPIAGQVVINTAGSDVDTLLAVYTGAALSNLTLVASNDDISTNDPISSVTFTAVPNVSYQIAVDGFDGEPGNIQLHILMNQIIRLSHPRMSADGNVNLTLSGQAGKDYTLEVSSNLSIWKAVATLRNTSGIVEFTDFPEKNATTGIYRAFRVD